MIVAWQFTAWNVSSDRTLRDGSFVEPIPGNKLPGYLHLVPSGQQTSPTPVHIFEAAPSARLDDECEDDLVAELPKKNVLGGSGCLFFDRFRQRLDQQDQ